MFFEIEKDIALCLLLSLQLYICLTDRLHSSVKKILKRFCPFTLNGVTSLSLTFRRTALWAGERRFSGFKVEQCSTFEAEVEASANQILCTQI